MRLLILNIFNEITQTFKFRYVVYNFVKISLKSRYKKSILGFVWVIVTPMIQYLIIGFVFSFLARSSYPNFFVFMFTGTVFFNLFSSVISLSPRIMLSNEMYIKKIYLPKLIYILNTVLLEFVNFFLGSISLIVLAIVFQKLHFTIHFLFIFIPIILSMFFLIGISIIISVISVYIRDLTEIIPVAMNAFFFMTPILYPVEMVPAQFHKFIMINPFYYFIEMFRIPILHNTLPDIKITLMCLLLSVFIFFLGIFILKKFDNKIVFKL